MFNLFFPGWFFCNNVDKTKYNFRGKLTLQFQPAWSLLRRRRFLYSLFKRIVAIFGLLPSTLLPLEMTSYVAPSHLECNSLPCSCRLFQETGVKSLGKQTNGQYRPSKRIGRKYYEIYRGTLIFLCNSTYVKA